MCIPLNAIGIGKLVQVNNIEGGEILCKKLLEMGMNTGAIIKMVKNDTGALIVKVGESRLVLGRGMAQKVRVREI
ncbi:MAG TPA: FeoA domain-containing protein [Clostridium sp.]|uniref:FeoA family protein n=1 Tax=Clostridium sp. TaxID=1506 RepID=UPI002F9549B8